MADTEHEEDKRCTLFDKARKFCQRCSEFHTEAEWSDGCERYLGAAPIRRCKTCGGDHPLDRWPGNCMPERNWSESDLPVCRSFITDNLESIGGLNGIQCQVSGKFFTSKKRLRDEYKARGVVELGNDKPKPAGRPKPDRKAIKEAVARAKNVVYNEGGSLKNYRARAKPGATPFGVVK